ncbi:MAG: acyclic terpene utilization AtuA family protein, partial [Thermaerobacterales bacterium]
MSNDPTAGMLKVLVPTGHLAHTPIQDESFQAGVEAGPDALIADSGSNDIGPHPLGADVSHSPDQWQRRDLELMLLAARRLEVPMIIGSASDTGTDRGVTQYVEIIKDIARRHRLPSFKLAAVYAEQDPEDLRRQLPLEGLDDFPPLDETTLNATDRVVAVMGPEPIMAALADGADVIICGRACDDALFSAFC